MRNRRNRKVRWVGYVRPVTIGQVLFDTGLGIGFALLFSAVAFAMASVFATFACHFATSCTL